MYIDVIIFLMGILVFYIMISIIQYLCRISEKRKTAGENEATELEEIFFEQVNKGEKALVAMTVTRQLDLLLIKSLLQSEQIPFYIEFEYSSKIFPGLQIGSLGGQNIHVLEKDYEDAMKIIGKH